MRSKVLRGCCRNLVDLFLSGRRCCLQRRCDGTGWDPGDRWNIFVSARVLLRSRNGVLFCCIRGHRRRHGEFREVELGYYQSGQTPDGGPNQLPLFIGGPYAISFNSTVLPDANPDYSLGAPPSSNGASLLLYTVPDGAESVQLEFLGPHLYRPPTITEAVPEPSTWAMLLIGFAGIGFASYRRPRRQYTPVRSSSGSC
jgi:hypothetical protein